MQWQPIVLLPEKPSTQCYYEYILTVHTGLSKSSATSSKVFLRFFTLTTDDQLVSVDVSLNTRPVETMKKVSRADTDNQTD